MKAKGKNHQVTCLKRHSDKSNDEDYLVPRPLALLLTPMLSTHTSNHKVINNNNTTNIIILSNYQVYSPIIHYSINIYY